MRGLYLTVLGFLLLAGSAAALRYFSDDGNGDPNIAISVYIVELIAVSVIITGLGATVTRSLSGFALSGQNTYSLAKTQMAGWTIVVIATLFTTAELRIFPYFSKSVPDPLQIVIPGQLLAAMGIAVFTTAATPALLSLKTTQTPTPDQVDVATQKMAQIYQTTKDKFDNTGNLMIRKDATLASWSDLVSGEEVGNAGSVDLSKVQQLLITILLLGTYVGMVISLISNKGISVPAILPVGNTADKTPVSPFNTLPALSDSFVSLMAISHAGYLGYKAVSKPASDTSSPSTGSAENASPTLNGIVAPQAAAPPP